MEDTNEYGTGRMSSDLRQLISGSPLLETTTTSGTGTGTGRWLRQEALNLLEIRSRLEPKFKGINANNKAAPLWDEVSRIMSEEHGFQRSGRKCKDKFDNLYKYYKKTKHGGKPGTQHGKHYRFFGQLEALYGETNHSGGNFHHNFSYNKNTSLLDTSNQESYLGSKLSDTSLSLSNSSSSEDSDKRKKRTNKSWKVKVRNLIDTQMKKLMDKQEEWMEKMMNTIERKEQDRILREEEWRKQDTARKEQEHKLWASERAWIEARDSALIESLHKLSSKGLMASKIENWIDDVWPEGEMTRLIHLRSEYQQCGIPEEAMWDEISNKMACFGYDRSALMCKQNWDNVNSYLLKCNKKIKEGSICNQSGVGGDYSSEERVDHVIRLNDHVSSPPNGNRGNSINDSCFRYFMGDTNY